MQWDNFLHGLSRDALLRFSLTSNDSCSPQEQHAQSKIFMHISDLKGQKLSNEINITPRFTAWGGNCISADIDLRYSPANPSSTVSLKHIKSTRALGIKAKHDLFKKSFIIACTSPYIEHSIDGCYRPQAMTLMIKPKNTLLLLVYKDVLDPYSDSLLEKSLYKFDDSQNIISCSRDPFIIEEKGAYHMFFAARYSKNYFDSLPQKIQQYHQKSSPRIVKNTSEYDEEINSTIGHAVSFNLIDWSLKPPLMLPETASQFELPSVIKVDNGYVLTCVVSNGNVAIDDEKRGDSLFGKRLQYISTFFTSDTLDDIRLSTIWHSLSPAINKDTHPLTTVYAPTFMDSHGKVFSSAFNIKKQSITRVVSMDKQYFPFNIPQQELYSEIPQ